MRKWLALVVVVAFSAAGIGVVYAVDAALPDKQRLKSIDVEAARRVVLPPPVGTVDYAEFGYPAVTTAGAPELRYERSLAVPNVELAHLRESVQLALAPPRDESIAWIWLVVAGVLCTLMAASGMFLWRRRGRLASPA